MRKRLRCFQFCLLIFSSAFSQSHEQLWLEFQLSYPFANRYLLENTATYQTLLNANNKWQVISISPSFEYVLFPAIDLVSEVPLGYTIQADGITSFEIMPMVGARFHITQGKKVDIRILVRHQFRAFHQIEEEDWDVSNRTRFRGEMFISINGPNLFTDKLWYAFLDYEEFVVLDQQLDERYANLRRARIGLGYRLNYKHRFEISYTLQSSRNEIEGEFVSIDNVIQAKYKMYLNPAKVAPDKEK